MKTLYSPEPALLERVADKLVGFERDFFLRVWKPGLDVYRRRLDAIGFSGKERVLDCGTGMGQWLVALSERNVRVDGLEYEATRVDAVNSLIDELRIPNARVVQGSSEALPFEDASFDAAFVYGVIFLTDVRQTLKELARVLEPGGKLFLTANGTGWFTFLLIEEHNKSPHYDPRKIAADAIENTIRYLSGEKHRHGTQLIVPPDMMSTWLRDAGFEAVRTSGEGGTAVEGKEPVGSFYKTQEYLGYPFVYEVLCDRAGRT